MARKRRILVIGSHFNSGYSMLNFTRDNFDLINSKTDKVETFFLRPKSFFPAILPNKIPRKYSVYLDKYLIFGPYIFLKSITLGIDVVHVLDHSDSVYYYYVPKWIEFYITVHDVFAILAALDQIPGVKINFSGKIYQRLILSGLKRAKLAICISESTQKLLVNLLPNLNSVVLHNFVLEGVASQRSATNKRPDRYFLILMNPHWRKNRIASIEVWKFFIQLKEFADSHLVIVGKELEALEIELIGQENLSRVSVQENLNSSDIHALYRGCVAVINISKYEGFGMPIIEANLHKKICIYGGSPAFNEISPPDNIDWLALEHSIRRRQIKILQSEAAKSRVQKSVLEKFSGVKYRSELIKIYEETSP